MSLRRFLPKNRNTEAAQSSLKNNGPLSYTSNVPDGADSLNDRMRALSAGSDSVTLPDEIESSLALTDTFGAETSKVATPRYSKLPSGKFKFSSLFILLVYFQIYAGDGAIPSMTPVASSNPFLGCIKARSVAPPHTVQTVKLSIANVENIKDCTSTSLFLTPYGQSPMGDTGKVAILNRTGPGSMQQEPLALVAKMSGLERRALESEGRGELANATEPDTRPPGIRYRTSIQHSYFSLHNILTVEGSVLSTLLQQL